MTVKENFEEFHNAASSAITLFIRLLLTVVIGCLRGSANFMDMLREMTYPQLEVTKYDPADMIELQSEVILSDEPKWYTPVQRSLHELDDNEPYKDFNHYQKLAIEGV